MRASGPLLPLRCLLAMLLAASAVAPMCRAAGAPPPPDAAASCAGSPGRPDYVSLRADTLPDLALRVAACERMGYRRVGGVARAVIANPGAASAEWYYQVMIVPAGAASAAAASAAAR